MKAILKEIEESQYRDMLQEVYQCSECDSEYDTEEDAEACCTEEESTSL